MSHPHTRVESPFAATVTEGRVIQVNISPGGVPKRAVSEARVGPLGLVGDRHRADTVHGGPHRAVCLFGIEAIERVAGEGNPIEPGSVGENLTTEGIDWSLLPPGLRIAVGDEVLLELSAPANPCDTIVDAFHDRRSGRISILRHPADSRMYARVLVEGTVRTGDRIVVLPPADGTLAGTHRLLDLLDAVERHAYLALWGALAATGRPVHVLDQGELAAAACPAIASSAFNRALGHRQLPNLVDRLLDVYRRAGAPGWIVAAPDAAPWPGAEPGASDGGSAILHATLDGLDGGGLDGGGLDRFAADRAAADQLATAQAFDPGIAVRKLGPDETASWADAMVAGFGLLEPEAAAWRDLAPHLARATGEHLFIAERDGRVVGAAALFARRKVGLLAAAAVIPEARGRGVHRALIAARTRLAAQIGCDRLMATATSGGPSERNLVRAGLRPVWARHLWRFDPTARPHA
ncbi:MAG: GNAT family N-acetyltransferase [Chloroflexi bacterium]|nr:GNAT family N-acetyltransferase [Chloroflexota bacterium]